MESSWKRRHCRLTELFFGGGFLFAWLNQSFLTEHTGNGVMTARQKGLAFETLGTKAGLVAQSFTRGGHDVPSLSHGQAS